MDHQSCYVQCHVRELRQARGNVMGREVPCLEVGRSPLIAEKGEEESLQKPSGFYGQIMPFDAF